MGRRLAASLRASDMLGRLGGDEFVLIGPGPALARGDAGPIGHEVLRGEAEEAARAGGPHGRGHARQLPAG